jgi:phage-related protein
LKNERIDPIGFFLYYNKSDAVDHEDLEVPILRGLVWMGNSKRNIQAFPEGAQKIIGDELQLIQFGGMPRAAKPFKGVGTGIFEIALRFLGDAFRTVVAVQLGEKIYVLHAFQKKSKKGSATPKREVDLIRQRYAKAMELAENER